MIPEIPKGTRCSNCKEEISFAVVREEPFGFFCSWFCVVNFFKKLYPDKSCVYCGGQLSPTNQTDRINEIQIQIYRCKKCRRDTKIPARMRNVLPPLSLEEYDPHAEPTTLD